MKLVSVLTVIFTLALATGSAAALGQYQSGTTGVDVSWPNCKSKIPQTVFGITGVNDGKGFSENPCLKAEAGHFANLSLYVNTGYPGQNAGLNYQNSPQSCANSDLNCLAYNYGYNAGQYAVKAAQDAGQGAVRSWWLDVETLNTWTNDSLQNQSSLKGESDALLAAGATTVGVYSTTAQWGSITGGWQNGWPSWGATTWNTAKEAATYCTGHEFTGGPSYLMQFTPKHSLDQDYAC